MTASERAAFEAALAEYVKSQQVDAHSPDKSNRWAADAALKWWGDKVRQETHYGQVAQAGRQELVGAQAALAAFVTDAARPAIRRGTAASLLDPRDKGSRAALARALADQEPLVRHGALEAAGALEPSERLRLVSPLFSDSIRTIRIQAAQVLTSVPAGGMTATERAPFEAALAEYVQSQQVDADRAEAHLNLGALYLTQGDPARAEAEYRTAIALMPAIGGAWANLADLYRAQGREEDAEKTLRQGLEAAPRDPGVHHALGLALVRAKRMPEAIVELRKAAELPPDRARYDYVYGVALDSVGQTSQAIAVLAAAHGRHSGQPGDPRGPGVLFGEGRRPAAGCRICRETRRARPGERRGQSASRFPPRRASRGLAAALSLGRGGAVGASQRPRVTQAVGVIGFPCSKEGKT